MIMCSLDTSTTCSGIAKWENGELVDWKELKPKHVDIDERMILMAKLIIDTLNEFKPETICIERPQGHGANVQLARNLGKMLGVVMGWCSINNCEYTEINPSTWRSLVMDQGGLKRNELKKLSIETVKDKYGIEASDDVCDSILIGEYFIKYFKSIDIDRNI